jgi:hypothetical protein
MTEITIRKVTKRELRSVCTGPPDVRVAHIFESMWAF